MMSSRVLSRLLPVAEGDVSIFGSVRRDQRQVSDIEAQHARHHSEHFRDSEDDPDGLLFDNTNERSTMLSPDSRPSSQASPALERLRPRWLEDQRNRRIDEDEDVPESLLLEGMAKPGPSRAPSETPPNTGESGAQSNADARWRAVQEHHRLHEAESSRPQSRRIHLSGTRRENTLAARPSAETEAMWLFTNATNLDAFLLEVYEYYTEHGVYSILLSRALNLLTEVFVFSFAMFLTTCIDYSIIPKSHSTAEVMIPQCMKKASRLKTFALFLFVIYVLWRVRKYIGSIGRLFRMHDFYHHVLGIPDQDIQTVSWVRVVDGLVKIQNANVATADQPAKVKALLREKHGVAQQRMNAETIANRLMRQDNFYVAMYNKDILDFTLPIPLLGTRQFYSKSLEWCIDFCLTNFIFDEQGNIRPFCLDVKNRKKLVDTLRRRLQFTAAASVLVAPVNILRFCIIYFFRYYTEFTRNASKASARSFTPFAEWKCREFNELDHLFQRRLRQAYPFANEYLKQFPKDKTDQLCRFAGFISGAIAAVLTIATLLDHELFLGFEVTPGRTAVFWLTIMLGIFGFAHGMLPDENEVHDPVLHLQEVLMFMHYMPAHWKGRLHSNEVRAEFSALYQLRILIFLEEILSLILAPWILLRNARDRSDRIVDFFREHTVHVDGVGYQCNFAVFGFKKDLNAEDPTAALTERDGLRDDYFGLKDDKMAASVHNFMQYYSHYKQRQTTQRPSGWQPPPAWPLLLGAANAEQAGAAAEANRGTVVGGSAYGRNSGIIGTRSQRISAVRPSNQDQPRGAQDRRVLASTHRDSRSPPRGHAPKNSISKAPISESRLMAQDSDLGDYGGFPGEETLELPGFSHDESAHDDDSKTAGVLGMLYQYSKAQTDKGAGVNI